MPESHRSNSLFILDFGCRASGSGFRLSAFGFRFSVFGFRYSGFELRAPGFVLRASGCGLRVSGSSLRVSVPGFDFRCLGFGLRVSVLVLRVWGHVNLPHNLSRTHTVGFQEDLEEKNPVKMSLYKMLQYRATLNWLHENRLTICKAHCGVAKSTCQSIQQDSLAKARLTIFFGIITK